MPQKYAKLCSGSVGRAVELATFPQMEEQRKTLFRILADRPKYPELSKLLEKLEEEIEAEKEEAPLRSHALAESLFSHILMWFRDQHLKRIDRSSEHLFFPEESAVDFHLPALREVEKKLNEVRSAYQRNIKFSVCLTKLFLF